MLREIWKLLRDFIVGVGRVIKHGVTENRKGLLISLAIVFVVIAGLLTVVLEVTASADFCGSCHNMKTYIDSWRESTHKSVPCTDCHFEPGLYGMLEGKWKAQAHIVMKITGTAPSRPHTQISDASCLRTGCHKTDELAQKKTIFKGVEFSHGTHLTDLRRGKKLRCVSCHSQIVQGQHLTITESTCFTCHFYGGDRTTKLADCNTCHKKTKAKIFIDANESQPFVHKDYLDRGVVCSQCHFDIVSGDGHLKDNICVQCHSEPDILTAKLDINQLHKNHITDHKVECYRCHNAISHGIVRVNSADLAGPGHEAPVQGKTTMADSPLDSNCVKCHNFEKHKSIRLMYMGTGAEDVANVKSPMFAAHADCGSCHVAIKKTPGGEEVDIRLNFEAAIKSCADCHGQGYDVMARNWKNVLTAEIAKTESALAAARGVLTSRGLGKDKNAPSVKMLDTADRNLAFVRKGRGVHNIDYALKVLTDCQERAEKAKAMVLPSYSAKPVVTPNGCTQLCHSCVECIETRPVPFGKVKFPHEVHVKDEGLKCQECHTPREQHGGTLLKNCNQCHHGSGTGSVTCQDCHVSNFNLLQGQNACDEASCDIKGQPNPMATSVKCTECHVAVAKNKSQTLDAIKTTCIDCHDKSYGPMVDDWIKQAKALDIEGAEKQLKEVQGMVLQNIREGVYTYDAQELLNNAEKNLKLIKTGNPVHNIPFTKELLAKINDLVGKAKKVLISHSTIKTLEGQPEKK